MSDNSKKLPASPNALILLTIIGLVWFGFLVDKTNEYAKQHILISLDDHQRMDELIKPKALLLMGDSHLSAIPTSQYFENAVNLAIGYQSSFELEKYIGKYNGLTTSRTVILSLGTNDLILKKEKDFVVRYAKILLTIPKETRVIVNTVPPITRFQKDKNWGMRTQKINLEIKAVCAKFKNCQVYDLHNTISNSDIPLDKAFDPDGIHLSKASYDIWLRDLQELVK